MTDIINSMMSPAATRKSAAHVVQFPGERYAVKVITAGSSGDDFPTWSLERQKARARHAGSEQFCREKFAAALRASNLNAGSTRTMLATLDTADASGFTVRSGRQLAAELGIRAATVSKHWAQARAEGVLLTRYRYNKSSIQQLTWPGQLIELRDIDCVPLQERPWSWDEELWWLTGADFPAPWGDGSPPF